MYKEVAKEEMLFRTINNISTQLEYALRKGEIPTRVDVTYIIRYAIYITEAILIVVKD